ncbi:hypothetical protein [Mesorhizobium sp. B2-3-4]|uniref:hypothetical protein n=1 Tax=Mesorhizobium sp. B2-3-4 TaxID=2589959 RepID=UPI00112826EE|nr:hypothetical protein [Mesorhizobium sp. B2-3-4]TPM30019.1 hypothetical protein FJ967_27500 [Mesorhizobium sp. B2-3-4]
MFYPGRFLEPKEIAMLARVTETISSERGVAPKSPERERLAAHLLKLFMNGLAGEDELLDAERNRARRQRMTVLKLSGSEVGLSEAA